MKTADFLKNVVKYCIPSVVSAVIGVAVIPVISRIFPTADYGKINLFYSVGNMMLYIVLLGLDSAYIRFYFEQPEGVTREQIFKLAFWTGILADLIVCLTAVWFFPRTVSNYLYGEYNNSLIILLAGYVVGLILFRLLSIETRMENKAVLYNIQQILLIFTNRVSFVIVAFKSTNYKPAIIAITISSLLIGFLFLIIQKKPNEMKLPLITQGQLKTILAFAIPFMPTTVMTWLNNAAAKLVLSGYQNFNGIGVLSIATSVANVFSIIPSAFAIYWSPFIYKNYKTEQVFIKKVHDYICIISIIICIIILCFQDVLYIIVGGEYKSSQPYFMLVMMAPIQSLLCETTCYGIVLSNKTKYNLYISIISVLFNIGFGYFFYPVLRIYSIVVGISGAAIIQLILKTYIGQKYYISINNRFKTIAAYITIIVIVSANIFVYNNYIYRAIISVMTLIIIAITYKNDLSNALTILVSYLNTKR